MIPTLLFKGYEFNSNFITSLLFNFFLVFFLSIHACVDGLQCVLQCGGPSNVGDLQKQPFYRFIQSTYIIHPVALGVLLYGLGGFPFLVWGMVKILHFLLFLTAIVIIFTVTTETIIGGLYTLHQFRPALKSFQFTHQVVELVFL